MRKQLLVFVSGDDGQEDVSLTTVASNEDLILINCPLGKFAVSRSELAKALTELDNFDSNTEVKAVVDSSKKKAGRSKPKAVYLDVSYGEE